VGVASRTVSAPDGSEWQVRIYRFRAPRWRQFGAAFSEEPDGAGALFVIDLVAGQPELGYNRVEPHNVVFEGFADA
jgi:hypothetical protein